MKKNKLLQFHNLFKYLVLFLMLALLNACGGGSGGGVSEDSSATENSDPLLSSPQNVNAVPANGQVTLSWDNVTEATGYNVYWNTSGNVTLLDNKISNVTSPYLHTSLINGETYYYTVTALNSSDESNTSSEVLAIPQLRPQAPDAPQNIQTRFADSQITISWNTVADAVSYNIYWNTTGNVTRADNKITSVTSPYTHTNLDNGTDYYYIVTAVNSTGGESVASAESSATPAGGASSIAAPVISAENQNGVITLSWDPIAEATAYQIIIDYFPDVASRATRTTVNAYGIYASSSPQAVFSTGKQGQPYYFIVKAINSAGDYSAPSNEVTATPMPDASLASVPIWNNALSNDSQLTVSWDTVTNATSYHVYMSSSPTLTVDNYATLADGSMQTVTDTTFIASNLTNGSQYYFLVTAVNDAGESAPSIMLIAQPFKGKWSATTREPVAYMLDVNGARYAISRDENMQVPSSNNLILYKHISDSDTWIKMQFDYSYTKNFGDFESAHVVNGKVYILGNNARLFSYASLKDFVYELDPANQRLIIKSHMPTIRKNYTSKEINGKIYTLGGIGTQDSPLKGDFLEIYDVATNTWSRGSNMPVESTSQSGLVSYVIDSDIYIARSNFTDFYKYEVASNTWDTMAAMPLAQYNENGACVADGKLYTFGNGRDYSDAVYEYTPTTNSWLTKATIPQRRRYRFCLVNNGKIYILNGTDTTISGTALLDIYDIATNSWGAGSRAPFKIHINSGKGISLTPNIAYIDNKIHYRSFQGTIQKYNISSNLWESPVISDISSLGEYYSTSCAASFGNDIYYAMIKYDRTASERYSQIVKYDTLLNSWSVEYSILFSGTGLPGACIPSGDKLYFIGSVGEPMLEYDTVLKTMTTKTSVTGDAFIITNQQGSAIDGTLYTVHWGKVTTISGDRVLASKMYDTASDTWSDITPMPGWRERFTTSAVGGNLYVFGGKNPRPPYGTYSTVLMFDPVNSTWENKTRMPTPSESLSSAVLNGKIYITAGQNSDNIPLDAVEEYDPVTDSWTKLAPLPEYFFNANVSASSNGKLYLEKDGKIAELDPGR